MRHFQDDHHGASNLPAFVKSAECQSILGVNGLINLGQVKCFSRIMLYFVIAYVTRSMGSFFYAAVVSACDKFLRRLTWGRRGMGAPFYVKRKWKYVR